MKKSNLLVSIIVIVSFGNAFSQNLFDTEYDNCNVYQFSFEKDTVTADIPEAELVRVITGGFEESVKTEIRGTISLQILIDDKGNSCLQSLKNETNVELKKLHLKESVNDSLVWGIPFNKLAVVILLRFEENKLTVKRLGLTDKGFHELRK